MPLHIYDTVILDPLYNKWLNGGRNGDSSAENWVVMEVFQTSAANIDQSAVWSVRRSQCISHMLDDSELNERGQVCLIPYNRRNNSLSCHFKPVWLSVSQWNVCTIEENLESWAKKKSKNSLLKPGFVWWTSALILVHNIKTHISKQLHTDPLVDHRNCWRKITMKTISPLHLLIRTCWKQTLHSYTNKIG